MDRIEQIKQDEHMRHKTHHIVVKHILSQEKNRKRQ